MAKELTEKQQAFISVLFGEARGDLYAAKKLAGYSSNTQLSEITAGIKDEIIEATKNFMAHNAPKAAYAIIAGIDDPTELGIRDKLNAAKDLLDRSGIIKSEKMQVENTGGVFILPPKAVIEDDDD
jgi:hypothetical protein